MSNSDDATKVAVTSVEDVASKQSLPLTKKEQRMIIVLCGYAFLLFFQPCYPFNFDYYINVKHLTKDEVYGTYYTSWTVFYMFSLLILAAVGVRIGYAKYVTAGVVSQILLTLLMLYGSGFWVLLWTQVFAAFTFATFRGFNGAMYRVLARDRFQMITSYVTTTTLCGTFTSSLLGHYIVNAGYDMSVLYYIALCVSFASFAVSLFLPKIDNSTSKDPNTTTASLSVQLSAIIQKYRDPENRRPLVHWTLYFAFLVGMHVIIMMTWQTLFFELRTKSMTNYNGLVNSISVVCATLGAASTSSSWSVGRILSSHRRVVVPVLLAIATVTLWLCATSMLCVVSPSPPGIPTSYYTLCVYMFVYEILYCACSFIIAERTFPYLPTLWLFKGGMAVIAQLSVQIVYDFYIDSAANMYRMLAIIHGLLFLGEFFWGSDKRTQPKLPGESTKLLTNEASP